MMQEQYWATKNSVLRKLGKKEDQCIVSSDSELDTKLGLLRAICESNIKLQHTINVYKERISMLSDAESMLGVFLSECSKGERNSNCAETMSIVGKHITYAGHQLMVLPTPLGRLRNELETFRSVAIADTKMTLNEVEKARSKYRAALSWMKSASNQLDPDRSHTMEGFRKSQMCVKTSKNKFDHLKLDILQKVDLLVAARCNMFNYLLGPYENAMHSYEAKVFESFSALQKNLAERPVTDETFDEMQFTGKVEPAEQALCDEGAVSEESPSNNESTSTQIDAVADLLNLSEDSNILDFFDGANNGNNENSSAKSENEKSDFDYWTDFTNAFSATSNTASPKSSKVLNDWLSILKENDPLMTLSAKEENNL